MEPTSHPSTHMNHSPLIMANGFENFCLPSTSSTPVHNITYSNVKINSTYRSTMTNRNVQLPPTLAYPHIYSQQFHPISNPYLHLPPRSPQNSANQTHYTVFSVPDNSQLDTQPIEQISPPVQNRNASRPNNQTLYKETKICQMINELK